ncbi:ShET2/EspL2 family type III secretion system effector toxin (plasmid) [Escherichia albertii]|uniref:ShET2/EspL2 family type III secretion system effector toxin n=1 Tax=Escherichia albertii TaxID=208962 RepID=UPI000F5EF975|nr:ShET2/EspL2 family type III secretion system effector toxin [Escherichia albertii]QTA00707.1 ShET2/EspL2 family type III secretion system effector toxin [Escherichia albertii]QTA05066.1 ShET2/EspL2 family type III secretion system effector toxin [Escherichia albertii]WKU78522.1 ShET2/EspL2 family type III secretion system effector toxin [Escherichia albertii]
MPTINKTTANYTEYVSKNNQPYLSRKRDASINLNGQVSDNNGSIIWCRHISSYWSDFFCGNSGKIDYEIFSSPQLLSKAIVVEENKGTNNIKGDVYFVENESWGEVIYNVFRQMEQEKKAYTALEIHSPGHTMALGIKIKKDKENKLVINFYDPNQTATHKRVFFCTKNIIDVRKLTAYDFLSEACLKCYGLKEETLSLFVDKTKSIENNNVSIKKLPDNLLQSVVINFAMGAGLREIIKKTYNDSQFSGLTISQMESLCEAKNVNHVPGLLLALQNGNDNAIDEYGVLIKKSNINKEKLIHILSARTVEGTIPGLYQALQNGHAQAIKSYGKLVLDNIDENRDLEYLLSAFKCESYGSNKYTPGLFAAFQNGHADAIRAYCDVLKNSNLTRSEIIRMLEARNYDGAPGLLFAYQNGDINTIQFFFDSLVMLDIPKDIIEELLTVKHYDFTGLSLAISHGHAQVVQLYSKLLKKLDTSPYQMARILALAIGCERNNVNLIIGGEYKSNKAVKEYVEILKEFNIYPEKITKHLGEVSSKHFLDVYKYYYYD